MPKFQISILKVQILLVVLAALSSCSDDDKWAPPYITDFAELRTDASCRAFCMTLDDGRTFSLDGSLALARPDTTYRYICLYTLDDNARATITSASAAFAPEPVTDTTGLAMKTDPCEIQSIWRGGNWLNARMLVQGKDQPHIVAFIDGGIATDASTGVRTLTLLLYHDQNGDPEAFTRTIYLSCPLRSYADRLLAGRDSIHFVVRQRDKGLTTLRLAY